MKKTYGLQNETRQYLRRLYAYGRTLRGEDINDIDNFVKGLKQLGLWGNIIDGWILGSNYNMGTGSLVSSLNGRFNGTLINSPSWGTQGIAFTSNTQQIDLGRGRNFFGTKGITEFCNLAVLKTDASNSNSNIFGIEAYLSSNPTTGIIQPIYGPNGNGGSYQGSLTGGTLNRSWGYMTVPNVGIGFYFAASGRSNIADPTNSEGFSERNNTRNTAKAGTGNLPRTFIDNQFWIFGSQSTIRSEIGNCQFWFNKMLNATQTANLRSLLKTTIARGLSLP